MIREILREKLKDRPDFKKIRKLQQQFDEKLQRLLKRKEGR